MEEIWWNLKDMLLRKEVNLKRLDTIRVHLYDIVKKEKF